MWDEHEKFLEVFFGTVYDIKNTMPYAFSICIIGNPHLYF